MGATIDSTTACSTDSSMVPGDGHGFSREGMRSQLMRVMLLYNPVAGTGSAAAIVEALSGELRRAGHEPVPEQTVAKPGTTWLDESLSAIDVLVVLGGDGAIRLAAEPAMRTDTPIYPFPMGTENLFARQFRSTRSLPLLLDALRRFEIARVDVGRAAERTFLLMTSVGFDASVVHDLAARRRGGISHLSYLRPALRQLVGWRPSALTLHVDGECVVDARPGCVFAANSRQYAIRLDPASDASMTDGLLDLVFFPCRSVLGALGWLLLARSGRHRASRRLIYRKGTEMLLISALPRPVQMDGDPAGTLPASGLSVGLEAAALPVLVP